MQEAYMKRKVHRYTRVVAKCVNEQTEHKHGEGKKNRPTIHVLLGKEDLNTTLK